MVPTGKQIRSFSCRGKDPLLLFHGANDPRVPAGESVQIARLLEAKKIPVQMVLFGDEGRGVRKRKNRAVSLANTLQFFTKHLKPYSSSCGQTLFSNQTF
jgi:dipeptidyl aminopeptidase/acylaminoacyl peptidase